MNLSFVHNLTQMPIGQHSFSYALDDAFFASLAQDEIKGGVAKETAFFTAREHDFTLSVEIVGSVNVVCERCLASLELEVKAHEIMRIELGKGDDDNVIYVDDPQGNFDLSWLFYEIIETNLPLVHRHQPGECNPQMEELLRAHSCTNDGDPEDKQ